jgi:hypothetical protein
MKQFFLLNILIISLLTVSLSSNAQGSAWVALSDNTPSPSSFWFNISTLSCDSSNYLYTKNQTGCFGEQLIKYKNNTWSNSIIGGCDEHYMSNLQKDSLGQVYALHTYMSPAGTQGWLYGFKGDVIKLYDTGYNSSYNFNGFVQFTVTKSGKLFVVKNEFASKGVHQWNSNTNNWIHLKGTGNDTINAVGSISNLYSDKNENIIAAAQNGAIQKYLKWNGTKWLEMGTNSGYLNNTNLIENIIKDNAGNIYGYGKLAALTNQVFRAKWNETSLLWEQLPYTSTNPFSDTCIKPNSITYDKFGNAYGISQCKNSSNREYVAKWNETVWQELGNLVINGAINAIAVDNDGVVYAGGTFTNASGKNYVAKYQFIAPVKILHFTAVKENNAVVCKWQTASEINFSHFEIQRSFNGTDFTSIGAYVAKGIGDYAFTDLLNNLDIKSNSLFYRLKLVDKDASFTYSEIKNVHIASLQNSLQVYPTPAKDFVTINCVGGKNLFIIDFTGRTIVNKSFNNSNQLKLDVSHLNKGLYVVQVVTANGGMQTQRIIVE